MSNLKALGFPVQLHNFAACAKAAKTRVALRLPDRITKQCDDLRVMLQAFNSRFDATHHRSRWHNHAFGINIGNALFEFQSNGGYRDEKISKALDKPKAKNLQKLLTVFVPQWAMQTTTGPKLLEEKDGKMELSP